MRILTSFSLLKSMLHSILQYESHTHDTKVASVNQDVILSSYYSNVQ